MPIEVDESERLAEIAQATVEVAKERGTRAVTIRAVAEVLGRSTAFITNFVPSRAHLMANALEHAQSHWRSERIAQTAHDVGVERLAMLARWMCTSTPEDNVLRSLWIEVIADVGGANRRAYDLVRSVTDATYEEFLSSSRDADLGEASAIADILYLYCRGFHVKTVEDPDAWTDERVNVSLETLLQVLLFDRAANAGAKAVVPAGVSTDAAASAPAGAAAAATTGAADSA